MLLNIITGNEVGDVNQAIRQIPRPLTVKGRVNGCHIVSRVIGIKRKYHIAFDGLRLNEPTDAYRALPAFRVRARRLRFAYLKQFQHHPMVVLSHCPPFSRDFSLWRHCLLSHTQTIILPRNFIKSNEMLLKMKYNNGIDGIRKSLVWQTGNVAREYEIDLCGQTEPGLMLGSTIVETSRKYGKPVVVIVDEYDKPKGLCRLLEQRRL